MTGSALEPQTDIRPDDPVRKARRLPWVAVWVLLGSLVLGSLLNADALVETASAQEAGWQRDVMVAVTLRLQQISDALFLNRPRQALDEALGRTPTATTGTPVVPPITTTTVLTTSTTGPEPTTTTTAERTDTTQAAPTTVTLPGVFFPSAEAPAALWVTGDSLTEAFGPALVNLTTATGVIEARREVRYSTGLTRPDFFDWPAYLTRQLDEQPTDILVFMIGANDGQPIDVGTAWVPFGTDEWSAEYRRRVSTTMDVLEDLVPTVYWIGQPIARSADYSGKMAVMNEIYGTEADRHANIRFVDTWDLFSDQPGNYSAYLPDTAGRVVLMRRGDGIHLTLDGGNHLAAAVLDVISEDWFLGGGS